MKKYFTLFIVLLGLITVAYGQTLSVGKVTGSTGSTVHVPVSISAPLANVQTIAFQFTFDEDKVDFKRDVESDELGVSNFAPGSTKNLTVTKNDGTITLSWFASGGATLQGEIFYLDFDFNSGFSEVKFVSAQIKNTLGKKIAVTLQNGSISSDTDPDIRLLYPNGGENIEITGAPTKIEWTQVYVSKVKLEYTINNGSSWDTIATTVDAYADSYLWTVPDTINSDECKIRITDEEHTSVSDASDDKFTIDSEPVIKLLTPNGGEELKVNGIKYIKWYSRNILNLAIEYSTNASASTPTWQTIQSSIAASDSMYEWRIPSTLSTNCKVRVYDLTHPSTAVDLSDAVFTIMNSKIKVKADSVVEAHLTMLGNIISFMGLSYIYEDSTGYHTSASCGAIDDDHTICQNDTLVVTGTVPVNVGWLTAVQYLNIKLNYDPNVLDIESVIPNYPELKRMSFSAEDGVLSIIWATGTPTDLHGQIFKIKFRYVKLTKPNQWIDQFGFDAINYYTPDVTLDARNFSDIKIDTVVVKNSVNEYIDASNWTNGSLAISSNPAVKLFSPIGGEVWEINDVQDTIYWDTWKVTNVSLQYTTGSGWNDVPGGSSLGSSSGHFSWAFPNTINSTNCRIRIFKSDNGLVADTSAKVFTITNQKALSLTSPDGGEILRSGTTKNITWTAANIPHVKLEYTIDDSTWTQIVTGVVGKDHEYAWVVPTLTSSTCRVKITDIDDTTRVDSSANVFAISQSKVKVSIADVVHGTGDITVPIQTEPLYSVKYIYLSVQFDTTQMSFKDIDISSTLSGNGLWTSSNNHGVVTFIWFGESPVDLNGEILKMNFSGYKGAYSVFSFSTLNQMKNSADEYLDFELVNGSIGTTDVEENKMPTSFALRQNYPNPFNPTTTIQYEIPKQTYVTVNIYNLLGQKVTTLVNENVLPGYHRIIWNSAGCASGIYFYSIITNEFVQTKKMVLLK